jgi:hypothetical protein
MMMVSTPAPVSFFSMKRLLMSFLFASLLLLVPAAEQKPAPKVPIGKDTTVVDGPLDADGFIDYEAALNERLRKTITPQTNANVLLWKVFGPQLEDHPLPPGFFKQLGIGELPVKGNYFVGFDKHLKTLNPQPDEMQPIYDQRDWATKRPWAVKDYPHIGAWVITNEKQLALVVEATKLPHYYVPMVSRRDADGKRGPLIRILLEGVHHCRDLAIALTARAMLRLGEGKDDEAWQDLLAAHRLAVLVASGATLIDSFVGIAIDRLACQADLAYLERAKLTTKQLRDRLKELQALPPLASIADKMDLFERFEYLDNLQAIPRGDLSKLTLIDVPPDLDPKTQERLLGSVDWAQANRAGNKWFDRAVSNLRIKDRALRVKELDRMEADLKALNVDAKSVEMRLAKLAMAGAEPDKELGKAISDVFIQSSMNFRYVQTMRDRSEQIRYNGQIAFALAAYRLDNKRYPAKLDDLAPKYLAAVPLDVFTGKPLTYRPSEMGYLFYSFGPNGKDDEGRWIDDEPRGDDPGVRMPLPELKRRQ